MAHKAEIAHHVRGRVRMKVPAAKGNEELLEQIKQSLAAIPGVQEVSANSVTGSLVVNYDPAHTSDLHLKLGDRGKEPISFTKVSPVPASEVDELARTIEEEAEFLAEHSHTARAVVDFVKKMDQELKRATNNAVDLKVVFPLALAVYTFLELGFEAATPVWLTLGLFAGNHFVELHAHAGPDGSQPVRRPMPA